MAAAPLKNSPFSRYCSIYGYLDSEDQHFDKSLVRTAYQTKNFNNLIKVAKALPFGHEPKDAFCVLQELERLECRNFEDLGKLFKKEIKEHHYPYLTRLQNYLSSGVKKTSIEEDKAEFTSVYDEMTAYLADKFNYRLDDILSENLNKLYREGSENDLYKMDRSCREYFYRCFYVVYGGVENELTEFNSEFLDKILLQFYHIDNKFFINSILKLKINDDDILTNFACKVITLYYQKTDKIIENIHISCPKKRAKIATVWSEKLFNEICYINGSWERAWKSTNWMKTLLRFNITSEQDILFDILIEFCRRCPFQVAKNIKKLWIEDQDKRIRLAQECSEDALPAPRYIENFEIDDPNILLYLANKYINISPKETIEHLSKFGISSGNLHHFAMNCTKHSVTAVRHLIDEYDMEGDFLFQLGMKCAEEFPHETIEWINKFNMHDEIKGCKILVKCLENFSGITLENMNSVRINDKQNFEIVFLKSLKARPNRYPDKFVSKNLKKFDLSTRFDLAKKCARRCPGIALRIWESFQIANKEMVHNLMLECAKHIQPFDLNLIWYYFGMPDPKKMREIVSVCLKYKKNITHVNQSRIDNELFQSLEMYAFHSVADIIKFLETDQPSDEKAKLSLAKECFMMSTYLTLKNLDAFGLKSKENRLNFAIFCAKRKPELTAEYYRKFNITSQKERTLFALAFAKNIPIYQAYKLDCFLLDDKGRIDFLRESLSLDNERVFKIIMNNYSKLNEADEELNFKVALKCAEKCPKKVLAHIDLIKVKQEYLHKIFLKCLLCKKVDLARIQPDRMTKLKSILGELYDLDISLFGCDKSQIDLQNQLFEKLKRFISKLGCSGESKVEILKICERIEKLEPDHQQKAGFWFIRVLYLINGLNSTTLDWVVQSGIIKALSYLYNPELRFSYTLMLFRLLESTDYKTFWESDFLEKRKYRRTLLLITIPLFILKEQCKFESKEIKSVGDRFRYLRKRSEVNNIDKFNQLLKFLDRLCMSDLDIAEKRVVFEKVFYIESKKAPMVICADEQIFKNIAAASVLLSQGDTDWNSLKGKIQSVAHSNFKKIIPIEMKDRNVFSLIEERLCGMDPIWLMKYATGLKEEGDQSLLDCFNLFMQRVLNNTFNKDRYDISKSLHLRRIEEKCPGIIEKWKENDSVFINKIPFIDKSTSTFHIKKWLNEKLLIDKHLPVDLHFFKEYISSESNTEKLASCDKLNNKIYKVKASRADTQQELKLNILYFQKRCIELLNTGLENNVQNLLTKLDKLSESAGIIIATKNCSKQFLTDITDLKQGISQKSRSAFFPKHWKVTISDKAYHLLRCGTDVLGSCQKLDGDSYYNKCLLGYLMNGKNLLLAVVDGDGKKIIARCILRLLTDGDDPVLYRERFYPSTTPPVLKNALNFLARKRARELGIRRIVAAKGKVPYKKVLYAYSEQAPFDYADNNGGVMPDGEFQVTNGYLI